MLIWNNGAVRKFNCRVEGSGWFGQGAPEYEARNGGSSSWPGRISSVLHAVTEYRDARWAFALKIGNQADVAVEQDYLMR